MDLTVHNYVKNTGICRRDALFSCFEAISTTHACRVFAVTYVEVSALVHHAQLALSKFHFLFNNYKCLILLHI